ncbi:hypothetical protein R1sor_026676 [Riccia sorocarpa]|uniref:Uncharacterized protein n=1 Tax=Riccia sorocarpa TaxID=122646 RepID=A0ABD3GC29_9MARC
MQQRHKMGTRANNPPRTVQTANPFAVLSNEDSDEEDTKEAEADLQRRTNGQSAKGTEKIWQPVQKAVEEISVGVATTLDKREGAGADISPGDISEQGDGSDPMEVTKDKRKREIGADSPRADTTKQESQTSSKTSSDGRTIEETVHTWAHTGKPQEDPRRNWDLKWAAAKRILMKKAEAERHKQDTWKQYLEELNRHKIRIANDRTSKPDATLQQLEEKIKETEKALEKVWRRWSRVRWIKEGEMPSKFFFSMLWVKRAKENITVLKTEDGRLLDKEEEIVRELTRYYIPTCLSRNPSANLIEERGRRFYRK